MLPRFRPSLPPGPVRTPAAVVGVPFDLGSLASRIRGLVHEVVSLAVPRGIRERVVIVALLVGDLVFCALFVAYAYAEHYGLQRSPLYGKVEFTFVDAGYPELFGYLQLIIVTLLLVAAHRRSRQPVHLALALLFGISLLDDALSLHERIGELLAAAQHLSPEAGELLAWGLIGVAPAAAVGIAYLQSGRRSRNQALALLVVFALLLVFAVGVDRLHSLVRRAVGNMETLFTLLEDGGELLTITLACAVCGGIVRRYPAHAPQACD